MGIEAMPHEVGATERSSRSKSRDGGSGSGAEQPYSHPRSCKSTSGGVTSPVEADSKKSSTGKSKQASLPSSSSSRQQPDRAARNREASTGIIADVVAVSTVSKPQKPTPSEVFKTPTVPTSAAVAANAAESKDAAICPTSSFGTGCLVCRQDDHQDKILMCENVGCEGEYHIYCLQPPLAEVPIGAWYCASCLANAGDDGMEQQVAALPPAITSRFGEVVFAQGGSGYGWWPSLIFDPRLTVEPARSQARKHLNTRHLVYFFQCPSYPFSVLAAKNIKPWVEGLADDLHLGRTAKSCGKARYEAFCEAMQVACLEMDKPTGDRLDLEKKDPTAAATAAAAADVAAEEDATSATEIMPPPPPLVTQESMSFPSAQSTPLKPESQTIVEGVTDPAQKLARPRLSPDKAPSAAASHQPPSKRVKSSTSSSSGRLTGEWFRREVLTGSASNVAWTLCPKR